MLFGKVLGIVGLLILETVVRWNAETVLEDAELHRLETRRRNEQLAELEKVMRQHRLQDAHLIVQDLLNACHTAKSSQRSAQILLGDVILHCKARKVNMRGRKRCSF